MKATHRLILLMVSAPCLLASGCQSLPAVVPNREAINQPDAEPSQRWHWDALPSHMQPISPMAFPIAPQSGNPSWPAHASQKSHFLRQANGALNGSIRAV